MMASIDLRRRAVLRALAVGPLLAAAPALWAQDPRGAGAQKEAREWLALADRLDGPGSWNRAGRKFKDAMPSEEWTRALAAVRQPLGDVSQRTMISTNFDTSFPGAASGMYAHIDFRTAFGKRMGGETVTLELEVDGEWHVIGYSIH